jgi:hypothetical protein
VALDVTLYGDPYRYYEGWLQYLDSPGLAADPAVYCSLQDMLDMGGDWLPTQMLDSGRTNFLAERKRARQWFDQCFLARIRNFARSYVDLGGPFQPWLVTDADNPSIRGYLDSNLLIVTGEIIEANACKAIEIVCDRAISCEDNDPWSARAARYRARARNTLATCIAGLDLSDPPDGIADLVVNFAYNSMR